MPARTLCFAPARTGGERTEIRLIYEEFSGQEARLFHLDFFGAGGTLAPFFLASESPTATACFLLVTFLPLLPLFSSPFLNLCIASSTVSCVFFPYLAISSPATGLMGDELLEHAHLRVPSVFTLLHLLQFFEHQLRHR